MSETPVYQAGFTVYANATLRDRDGTPVNGDVGTTVMVVYQGATRAAGVDFTVPEESLTNTGPGVWEYPWVPTKAGDFLVEFKDTLDGKPRGKRQLYTIVEV